MPIRRGSSGSPAVPRPQGILAGRGSVIPGSEAPVVADAWTSETDLSAVVLVDELRVAAAKRAGQRLFHHPDNGFLAVGRHVVIVGQGVAPTTCFEKFRDSPLSLKPVGPDFRRRSWRSGSIGRLAAIERSDRYVEVVMHALIIPSRVGGVKLCTPIFLGYPGLSWIIFRIPEIPY